MVKVTFVNFEALTALKESNPQLLWNCPFVLPSWMNVWWDHFGNGFEPLLCVVGDGETPIGIAPFKLKGDTASLMGSENVCDYGDLITLPGHEEAFFSALLGKLKAKGVSQLDLGLLRPDSVIVSGFAEFAKRQGCAVSIEAEDVSAEMDIPGDFDAYLQTLNTKQRHEVRRKIRRLEEAGAVSYSFDGGIDNFDAEFGNFIGLFALAKDEKAGFMTPEMSSFFRDLAFAMAKAGLLRLGTLTFDSKVAAMIMAFDYNDTVYLYNSGFDPQYDSLSVGLLSKVFCIREIAQQGKKRFEFLKGNEIYKQRLGGTEIPLYRCRISVA